MIKRSAPASIYGLQQPIVPVAAIVFAVIFYVGYRRMQTNEDWHMVAHFPTNLLDRSNGLVDPTNLYTSYHYYLLENLGVGLVRDHVDSPSGYRGDLASEWHESADGDWIFKIRPELKWSSGQPITLKEIANLIETLSKRPSRHITLLKNLQKIDIDPDNRTITMRFTKRIGEALLHELSLSDSVLIKNGSQQSYTVTSGPYYWDSSAELGEDILLRRNPHYMHLDLASPVTVQLSLPNKRTIPELLGKGQLDLAIASYPPIASWISEAYEKAKVVRGAPTSIYFLAFNKDHPLHKDLQTRLVLANWARTAIKSMELPGSLRPEQQLIPPGYPGRLQTDPAVDQPVAKPYLINEPLKIDLSAAFKDAVDIVSTFEDVARQKRIPIELTFEPYSPGAAPGSFAYLDIFIGNQKDPIGSWSFLFKGPNAYLGPFDDAFFEVESSLKDKALREEAMLNLHQTVIANAYAIPLFIDGPTVFTSDRLDISKWNRFDMRHRYYDARIQQ